MFFTGSHIFQRSGVLAFAIMGLLAAEGTFAQSSTSVDLTLQPQQEVASPTVNAKTAVEDGAAALLRGETKVAVANYTVALKGRDLTKEKRAILLNDRGVALWRDNQVPQALADFNRAVGLYPEYAAIYNNRGTVLMGLGLVEEAIRDFDRAILLGPRYATAYTNRAGAELKRASFDKALDDYSKAASLRPGDAIAFMGRGRTHLLAGRPFAAERDFTKGISLAPKLVELYQQRREARLEIGRRGGAFEDLDQIVILRADTAASFVLRGNAYVDRNQRKLALRDFDRAIDLDPTNAKAHVGRAQVMLLYRGVAKARESIDAALALAPNSVEVLAVRAAVQVAEGDVPGGMRELDRAVRKAKRNLTVLLTKARTLETLKDREGAQAVYEQAYAVDQNSQAARRALTRYKVTLPQASTRIVRGAGLDGWQVHAVGKKRFYAKHAAYDRLKVPLEVYGKSAPRILDWEMKTGEFRGIGVLRYTAGSRQVNGKKAVLEQAAIVDLGKRIVHGLEPIKVGRTKALWNWDAGALTVRGTDGLVNTYNLRRGSRAGTAIARGKRQRRRRGSNTGQADWLKDPWGIQGSKSTRRAQKRRSNRKTKRSRRRKKKKTLFDLIFQ